MRHAPPLHGGWFFSMLSPVLGVCTDAGSYNSTGDYILPPLTEGQLTDSAGGRGTALLLSFLLAATVVLLYGPLISFPFVQDDWAMIHRFVFHGPASVLGDAFSPGGKFFYRPLAAAYCLIVYELFGLNGAGFHALSILILGSSAFLVVATARALNVGKVVAWLAGFLFATAAGVQFDPQMWLVGVFDTGATLLALLCVLAFLRGRYLLSGLAMAAAMGFKENGVLLLPAITALAILVGPARGPALKGLAELIRRIRWHAAAAALFVAVKIPGVSLFALPETHPYAARVPGRHIVTNLGLYGTWALQSVTPLKWISFSRTEGEFAVIAAFAAVALLALAAIRRGGGTGLFAGPRAGPAIFALVWFLCMLAPSLMLKTHVVRYYLTGALPPLALGAAIAVSAVARMVSRNARAPGFACALFAAACAADGEHWVIEKTALGLSDGAHASSTDGDDHLVRKATVVSQTMGPLLDALPSVPPHSLIVMEGIETFCFAGRYGVQVWYTDSTLLVTESVPPPPDSMGLTHAMVPGEDPWASPGPVGMTFPSSRVVHVRRTQEGLVIVPP